MLLINRPVKNLHVVLSFSIVLCFLQCTVTQVVRPNLLHCFDIKYRILRTIRRIQNPFFSPELIVRLISLCA